MQQGSHRRLNHSSLFLIIYSVVCTLWLIIRTGRRPNRITYPCQRAAASQSLWLFSYLLGSSPSLINKFFNRDNALSRLKNFKTEYHDFKRLFWSAVLITGIFSFSFNQPGIIQNQNAIWRSPANRTSPLPNLFATVTLADSSHLNSVITVIGSDNPSLSQPAGLDQILSYNQVKEMVWKALADDTSSKSLNDVISDSDWVVIKPNIVTAPLKTKSGSPVTYYWYQGIPHRGQNTDLRVVKAVIEYLVQHKNLRRISIAEGSAEWAKLGEPGTDPNMAMDGWTVHWPEYDNLSYEQIRDEINANRPGLVNLADLSYDGFRYVEVPDPYQSGIGGLQRSGYYMPNTVLDCDKWIDIAAMKTHSIPGLSLAMKLRIGTLANQAYGPAEEGYMELHNYGAPGVKQAIIDMYCYRPADYAIVEGIWGTEGNGPQWGNDIKRNVIVAGNNAVAVDAIGAIIMGYNPWDLDYLHLAGTKKLGTFNLHQINVVGDSIDHVAIDFAKPIMWPDNTPYVGRGNRSWLINGVYLSTDLDTDFLGNESSIQPYQGMVSDGNTWQIYESPTDKIDLKQLLGSNADNCIVYAFVYVNSSKNITTNLWIGVDDGIKVWVNGQVVFSEAQPGGYDFPEHKIPISLSPGANSILCKVLNYSQDFEFRLNSSDPDGDTPLEIEYGTTPPNIAPEVPQLLSPLDDDFIANSSPTLTWTIPFDLNNDSLHFLVQVSQDSIFLSKLLVYNSCQNNAGFSPTPPVPAGKGTMSFQIQTILADGKYWWRIAAWDGKSYSNFSAARKFTVNTTATNIAPQKPALISPADKKFINTTTPQLAWLVPIDDNGDSLHFNLQMSEDSNFSSGARTYSSRQSAGLFSPPPPYPSGSDTVQFTFVEQLSEKAYWWRVSAFDGLVYGSFSDSFRFVVDVAPPIIQSVVITEPNCSPNWYNKKKNATINVTINYQEHHASRASLFCSSIPLSIVKEPIPSGNFCAVDFEVDIANLTDGKYLFDASIRDSAENTTVDTFFIQLDSTPPIGARASSPDTSRSTTFTVTWQNTASDSGAGLSGNYDIQVKINDGKFETWKTQYPGTNCEFTEGKQGHCYSFEIAAWDRAGNREAFTGMAESMTLVDTLAAAINENQYFSPLPDHYYLKQNFPNPFNNATVIELGLPEAGRVRLTIYDLMGRTIKNILIDELKAAGTHRFYWDGTDNAGNRAASSLYFYQIAVNHFHQIKKLMFLK